MRDRRWALAVLALVALSCAPADEPEPWPAWPRDDGAVRALVRARTRHRADPSPPLTADAVIHAIDRGAAAGTLRAGWRSIADALRVHRVVVMGVHHDAGEHVRVFAQLFGPTGTADGRLWAVELFDADGRWRGVPAESQRGDDAALGAYRDSGSREAMRELRRRLAEGAYTAWKYDYLDEALELAVLARGGEQMLMGCDAPPGLTEEIAAFDEELRLRARELHCALALADARRVLPKAPVAILFGDAHAQAEGLARFLPETAARIDVIGGRRSDAGIDAELAPRLALLDPMLVPMGSHHYVLLLPDARLGAAFDRSRTRLDEPVEPSVTASAAQPSELCIGPVRLELTEDDRRVAVAPGRHAFVIRGGDMRIAGLLAIDEGGSAELYADVAARRVDVRVASPSSAPPGSL